MGYASLESVPSPTPKCPDVDSAPWEGRPVLSAPTTGTFTRRSALASLAAVGFGLPLSKSGPANTSASSLRKPASTSVRPRTLPPPPNLAPFHKPSLAREGVWRPAGRNVHGRPAVFTTTIRPLDTPTVLAGVAWMDTTLLSAQLYSGSLSPGGLFWKYTAPISPKAARTLVAAFNGGFLLKDSHGGYLSEGHLVAPLIVGAASLVIYRDGSATVGQWGRDVSMTPEVVAVRQNLRLLVDNAAPVSGLARYDVIAWGFALNNIVDTPRSALGITANGALVYVEGPMNIIDLSRILVRAGVLKAMVLDMNPLWPIFATYQPTTSNGLAASTNGRDLTASMVQTPARFFQPTYARDFITMSAR